MPAPKVNMELNIAIDVSGVQREDNSWELTTSYRQLATSQPNSPDVVAANGDINLGMMQYGGQFNKATDISFILDEVSVTDNHNRELTVYFASPRSSAITISGTDATSEFVDFGDDGSGNILMFTDLDAKHGDYSYCLLLEGFESSPGSPAIPIQLDPKIVNPSR